MCWFVRRLDGSHDKFCVKYMMQFFTLSAGGALATAFMFVKLNQTCDGSNNIRLGGKYNSDYASRLIDNEKCPVFSHVSRD